MDSVPRLHRGVGDSARTPFCLSRDGHAKWRGFRVDYAKKSLRYRLPYLNPYLDYRLRAVLYHVSKDTWEQGFSVDGLPMGRYRHEALVPETVWVTIPRGTYERDCQVELDVTRYSGDYAVLADLRIYECYPFRQKRGGGIQSHAALPLETGAALGEFIPTPFRNQVCINYSLLTKGSLSLKIYDVQGRYVRTLASGSHRSGQYVVRWDGTDRRGMLVPAGTYFCRLEADGTQDIRKLVLAR
jgi:hypothetical protein